MTSFHLDSCEIWDLLDSLILKISIVLLRKLLQTGIQTPCEHEEHWLFTDVDALKRKMGHPRKTTLEFYYFQIEFRKESIINHVRKHEILNLFLLFFLDYDHIIISSLFFPKPPIYPFVLCFKLVASLHINYCWYILYMHIITDICIYILNLWWNMSNWTLR